MDGNENNNFGWMKRKGNCDENEREDGFATGGKGREQGTVQAGQVKH